MTTDGEGVAMEIERIKKQLDLGPHPSGYGAFREMFKGDRQVIFTAKTSHSGSRSTGTSIYFLLQRPNSVQWHKHLSDEGFYWHAGGKVIIHLLSDSGELTTTTLGDVTRNEDCACQAVVPHDTWYSAELAPDAQYSLYSAVVIPGFEYEDWIQGKREEMVKQFPQHEELITRLT
ncbi:hypothetical protein MAR_034000 [Mya arenaria]|uniref:DUF985 domain-containing protein n=1 Tax=Mya arenaria TaxID=6604 RepID=A0ABY7GAL0_MYAAR|nr:uncharacterized protein LOC128224635 [Mya arenaria]XP_052790520.1 uncharacterized protein LOC128224635 [Mya arenaria]WAR31458.1 hypothetical protein MAR_034000 [Mya arenaria]